MKIYNGMLGDGCKVLYTVLGVLDRSNGGYLAVVYCTLLYINKVVIDVEFLVYQVFFHYFLKFVTYGDITALSVIVDSMCDNTHDYLDHSIYEV